MFALVRGRHLDQISQKNVGALTSGVAAGQPAAIAAFYTSYFDLLYDCARRSSFRDEAFCLDVVQDAMLRIIRTIRRADSEVQLIAWLRLVARTTAYDLLRREQRRNRHESAGRKPETVVHDLNDERVDRLRQEIIRLDPKLARLIELRYEQNWTLSRIAAACEFSIGGVDRRLRRALRILRYQMREMDCD